jgi:4-amino-4-deoxy-L-arabinose transferase-like glycosyltransferase
MPRDDDQKTLDTDAAGRPTFPPAGARARLDLAIGMAPLVTLALLVGRIPLLTRRRFDPDEFEHAHAAFCVARGMLPYQDFFEHHTPWYYYLLRPFFRWFAVDQSLAEAMRFLVFGRVLSLVLTVLSLWLVYRIGRRLADRQAGLLAAFMLAAQPIFFHKTFEIRPDVLALPFLLGSLYLLVCALARHADRAGHDLRCFVGSGIALGAAVMCTQKMLFVLPGLLVGLGSWTLLADEHDRLGARLARVAGFGLGLAAPGILTWAAFALEHGGRALIVNNFLLNAKWRHVVHEQLLLLLETSAPILILCLLGLCVALYAFFRARPRRYGELVLACTLLGLAAGVLVVPVAHRQYYLILLPLVAWFAARGLGAALGGAKQSIRAWLLPVAIAALSILPARALDEAATQSNDQQVARLREVFARTKPTDLVMDGWEGTGVFRPHAFYYFFLHEESLDMLAPQRVENFLDGLDTGRIRPRLIALDDNLLALGSRFVRFVKQNYTTTDKFFYWRRADE